jgi:predicted transposase YdaD
MPFRMLQYLVRLQAQYPDKIIEQVVIFLKRTNSDAVFVDTYTSAYTTHQYRVIRMWEQDPTPLLANPALLPLATLAASDAPNNLLTQVASQVARIENIEQLENIAACTFVLAGLRFEEPLINQLLTTDIMRESVTYQQILREGRQEGIKEGRQEGIKEGELALIIRQLTRRFGIIDPQLAQRLQLLSSPQLEDLAEVLLDFSQVSDLIIWLEQQGK